MNTLVLTLPIFIATFLLPTFSREAKFKWKALVAVLLVVFLHQIVAFTNAYWFTTIGAGLDAMSFHRDAVITAQSADFFFAIGGKFYQNFLAVFYWIFGPSHILGQQLSILAFSVSCIVLLKIARQLNVSNFDATILFAFGALPTMVFMGSVTLREPFQVLFFMMATFFGIKFLLKQIVNINFLYLLIFAIAMGLFHNGLMVYAIFMLFLFVAWALVSAFKFKNVTKILLLTTIFSSFLAVALFFAVKFNTNVPGLRALAALASLEIPTTIAEYRQTSILTIVSHGTYGIPLDLSSPSKTASSSISIYIHYMLAPFPWQVRHIFDLYASMESVLRITLLYFSIKQWFISKGKQRSLLGLLLVLYFSMTILWALGTTNYGTGIRHHMLTWWILVVAGTPLFMDRLRFLLRPAVQRFKWPWRKKLGDQD